MTTTVSDSVTKSINVDGNLLGVAFVVLKLCGVIHWSWLWVLAPWWVPLAVVVLVAAIVGTIGMVVNK